MAFTQKLFTSYHGYNNPDTRIGEINRIWYDSVTNVFRIQLDNTTPGGTIIGGGSGGSGSYTLPVATSSILGGVKVDGSTITISNGVISSTPASPGTGTGLIVGDTNATINSPTINNAVFQETFSIGTQVFYTHPNGFSVNEDFDITNLGSQANFTGYHFTSGAGKYGVAFTLARTGNFTDGFGITGDASNNNFVIGSETANTDYVFKTGIGMPFDVSGGNVIFTIRRDGTLVLANNSTIQDIPDDENPQGVFLIVNENSTQFDTGGRTHIPNDLVIKYGGITFVDTSYQTTAWPGSLDTIYIVNPTPSPGTNFRAGVQADLTNGVSINSSIGTPSLGTNYAWKFGFNGGLTLPGYLTSQTGVPLNLFSSAGSNATFGNSSGSKLFVINDTNLLLVNESSTWTFGNTGSLTFPDTSVQTTAYTATAVKGLFSVTTNSASGGGNLSYSNGVFTFSPAVTYSLPTASTSTLGGVKLDGSTITIDGSGVISSNWPPNNTTGSSGPTVITLGKNSSAGVFGVSIGDGAGAGNQSGSSVSSSSINIGLNAGYSGQLDHTIAIGSGAGNSSQGRIAIAIGYQAGATSQGNYAIAIGANAGYSNQPANTIILNATSSNLNGVSSQTSSFYVAPVRTDNSPSNVLFYNTTTNEVTYGTLAAAAGTLTGDTLASGVTASSLTSLGTLSSLAVTNSSATPVTVTYTPATRTGVALLTTGKDTQGGTGYFDFLRATNTTSGVSNGTKTMRLDSNGNLQILNNAYTSVVLQVSDAGQQSIAQASSTNNDPTTNWLSFNNNQTAIYDDGNTHIHNRASNQSIWINTNGGDLRLLQQSPVNGGAVGNSIIMGGSSSSSATAYLNVLGSKSYAISSYGYLSSGGAGTVGGSSGTVAYGIYCSNRIQSGEVDITSDERVKDIQGTIPLDRALQFVRAVDGILYTWRPGFGDDGLKSGFSAQKVHKAGFYHMIGHIPNENLSGDVDDDGWTHPDKFQLTMGYNQAIPYHHEVIKHLLDRIEQLEATVAKLTADK